MIAFYNTIVYEPILNLLIYLYNIIPGHDLGVAIILLTIIVKALLMPLSWKALKSQKSLQDIQPKMDALRKQYKDKKEVLAKEMMKLYKDNKVNPLSSCLPTLLQLPFLLAIYSVFRRDVLSSDSIQGIYSFIQVPEHLNTVAFGFLDLLVPSLILAIIAGIGQYIQAKMLMTKSAPGMVKSGAKDENIMAEMNKSMVYFMPLITIFIGSRLPSSFTLYWLITTILTIIQQKVVFSKMKAELNKNNILDVKSENKQP
ncbi:hypothetical protein A2533_04630 [Candidatus Falkowbacteria bacterium RIFOXYD2_FULL_35_9]|uniref:Membrane insertase YidC/Oxa/ALB C-terminal domain-containing protein n=1 Tax=Candidatus Falkowbacteria bacterium RIFOXYC2_FULL_36_12 TaxID=1798002 RepID=A0A1F5T347_9BACT|nr:MAG: hypothetical protein A2478_01605 [Candidatus Falkowbacteria bacterium RIFOXYC2_FULL_36_12]OGF33961.1 MAG: hypothetical protein A2223_03365 [Candidatus Falkowbacteria bacterium RIFOXYA2_FULL_35_8]OGF46059.1 MAG: hypothetical protein A2533_04630 [Candidatus Falkowbacteria bacterium RIFOXYD2_FULL_35_9]